MQLSQLLLSGFLLASGINRVAAVPTPEEVATTEAVAATDDISTLSAATCSSKNLRVRKEWYVAAALGPAYMIYWSR
jgi:hypothetical protein